MPTKIKNLLIDDLTFKYIFTKEIILIDFINSFLEYINSPKRVVYVKLEPQEILPHNKKLKLYIGDIICTLDDGTIVNIEMYSHNFTMHDYNKSFSYICRIYANQMKSGKINYEENKKVISIVFMNNNFQRINDKIVNSYNFAQKISHKLISEGQLEMYLIRLDKEDENEYTLGNKRFNKWLEILRAKSIEEMKKIGKGEKIMDQVIKYVNELCEESQKKGLKGYIEEKENDARAHGIEQGIAITAKAMLKNKINIETIIKCTGLTKEEILSLN